MKNISLLMFHITIWTCCIASIIVRPFSSLVANILFGIEILYFVVYITIMLIKIRKTNKEIRKMEIELFLTMYKGHIGEIDDTKE